MAIAIEPHRDGAILPVRAHPGARRTELHGEQAGMLKVSVSQAPEKGKANRALIGLLAKALGVRKSRVVLLSGETSRQKRFLIVQLTPAKLAERLSLALRD